MKGEIEGSIPLAATIRAECQQRHRRKQRLQVFGLLDRRWAPSVSQGSESFQSVWSSHRRKYGPQLLGVVRMPKKPESVGEAPRGGLRGIQAKRLHFSDRGILLYNTLDYPPHSLGTEKIRLAFRSAYSLFDKISFFLNHYFGLGRRPDRVSFRSVWYEAKSSSPRPLLPVFSGCPNWPLRGLFWLSKDLFEEEFQNVTEADAESLNEIRNHLEHKYFQLIRRSLPLVHNRSDIRYKDDFSAKTLRLLKLARAALMYMSLAVWSEERRRNQGSGRKPAVSPPLSVWRDEWRQ